MISMSEDLVRFRQEGLEQAEGSTFQEGFETFEQLTPRVRTNDYIIPQCSNERLYYPLVFERTIILSPSVQTNDYIIPQCSNDTSILSGGKVSN